MRPIWIGLILTGARRLAAPPTLSQIMTTVAIAHTAMKNSTIPCLHFILASQRSIRSYLHFSRPFLVCSGRVSVLTIDTSEQVSKSNGYLRTVCDYVHLNPVRAGLLELALAPLL